MDASSGQLSQDLDRGRSREARPRLRQSGHRPGLHRRRQAGRCAQGDGAVLQAVGLGLDRQHPGLRPAGRPVPRRQAASLELRPGPGARDVRAGRPGAAAAVPRHDRRGAGRAGPAQHHPAAQCRRQHGRARHRRGHRALPAGRGRGRAVLGRRHACRARRRRGLRHGDRKPDRRRAEVRAGEGRQPQDAALHHARPGHQTISTRRATRSRPASAPT